MATSARSLLLPTQPTPLVGRADELATIRRRLASEGARLLTLTGPAGVGKTRLALAAAANLAEAPDGPDRFPDGVVFVDLTAVREPALVLGSLAGAAGMLDMGNRPLLDRLIEALGERRLLAVLDNFEQVLPAAAALPDLLAACPGLALLVTSRVPLRLVWEQTLRVPPLPVPDPAAPLPPLDELAAIPSVALFVQRARAHRADFALTDKQARLVARLAAELDGLPLALELAAARTGTLALPAIAQRLGDRLRLLQWEAADVPERQRSLEAAVGWSYDLLPEAERRLFRCLGVFAGRVSLDAVAAVATAVERVVAEEIGRADGAGAAGEADRGGSSGDVGGDGERSLHGLLSLAEQSLILPARPADPRWQHGQQERSEDDDEDLEPAFGMLETVRAYAVERLAAAGELPAAQWAHARYFLALAERADPRLRGHGQRAWFLRLEREHDNLRAALRWLLDRDVPAAREAALRLAGALGYFWILRGYHAEGSRWLEEALDRAPQGEGTDPAVRTRALLQAGGLLAYQRDVARARPHLEEALTLALARRQQDLAEIVRSLTYLGQCAVYNGEAAAAVPPLEEALDRARALGPPYHNGLTLYFLGAAAQAQGHAAEAVAHYTAALESCEPAGDARVAASVHLGLAALLGQRGDLPGAVWHVRAGLQAAATLQERWLLSNGVRAALAVVGGHTSRAAPAGHARLLGAADALSQATGARLAVWEQVTANQAVAGLRAQLEQGEWEAAYREGKTLPAGEVVALALLLLDEVATLSRADGVPEKPPQPTVRGPESPQGPLSAREGEVLRLVAQGLSNKAIGQQVFLSASTVNSHLTSIFHKLGVETRAQAVAVAARRGLL